jgi:SWI/SNF-related matrix-associated actin-dependent regulator of chromatin subfamily A-like protein 1
MSIEQLNAEEAALLAQLAEVRRKKQEEIAAHNAEVARLAREKELATPFTLLVTRVSTFGDRVEIETESKYREDVIEVMRTIPSRHYSGSRYNTFDLEDWSELVERLSTLRNVEIEYVGTTRAEIEGYATQKTWAIDIDEKWLYAMPGRKARKNILYSVPGASWVAEKKYFKIPLGEAHTVWKRLEDTADVEWTPEANAFVIKQLQRRAALDTIAKMDVDEEYAGLDLCGMKLRNFQTVGARFMEVANGNALNADEMGLGKTIQSIAYAEKMGFKKKIVICPAALKPNWHREILKFTGKRALVLSGSEPGRSDMLNVIPSDSSYEWFIINYDIIGRKKVVKDVWKDTEGYEHEKVEERFMWSELITLANPDIVIVDEGHYIKNVDSQRSQAVRAIKAQRFTFLTGTPVLNRPGELWPMLTKIAPDTFPSYDVFLQQYTWDKKVARNTEELRSLLQPIMIRRLKKDVYEDLPAVDRREIYHELSDKAKKLYEKILMGVYDLIEDYHPGSSGESKKVTSILAQIQRLKMVCAIDKAERSADLATELYDQTDESEHRKVIIFSQYKGAAFKIARLLGHEVLSFVTRSGSDFVTANADERDRLVQQFQTDDKVKYLVVTEKTTKEGHNITAAGHVIFNDLFWTPAGHDQAIGRAYGRISDMHGVDAYFLITSLGEDEESIEDWIWELLAFKQGVIDETVEGVESTRDASIAMQLIEKVREKMNLGRVRR